MDVLKVHRERVDKGRHTSPEDQNNPWGRLGTLMCHSWGSSELMEEVRRYPYDHMCSYDAHFLDLAVEGRQLHYSGR
jgi:hypothetical protein